MASLIYNSFLYKIVNSDINFDTDKFKMMLVGTEYTPDKDTDTRRFDVSDEVTSAGYSPGGLSVQVSISRRPNSRIEISLGSATWDNVTISAIAAVYYRSNGLPSEDDLVCYTQFSEFASSTNGSFTVTSTILRIQN